MNKSESRDLFGTSSDIAQQLMGRLLEVSKTGSPYNDFVDGPSKWYEPIICAIKNETGTWLPMDWDGRPVPPAPGPPGSCSNELNAACPHNGSSVEVCLTCTRNAAAPDCGSKERHAYCGPDNAGV